MSNNRFVEVTRRGYFQRLVGSFAGIAIGFLLIVASVPLLWWNEGRAVKAQRALDEATKLVVDIEAAKVDAANNGKLVHVTGDAVSHTPVRDGDLGLVFDGVILVARTVEMYEWQEQKDTHTVDETGGGQRTETTYSYREDWSDEWKNSEQFRHPTGHANPQMALQSQSWAATGTTLGAFALEREALLQLQARDARKADKTPDGWKDAGDWYYRGADPDAPKLGDLRMKYTAIDSPAPVSVMARQMGPGFDTYEMPNGYAIFFVSDGIRSSEELIKHQRDTEMMVTWLVRGGGLLLMWIGFCLAMGPLRALANVLPFLAEVAGFAIAVVALALTLPIGLGTIGIAWLFYRPIIGVALLAAGIVASYVLVRLRHRVAPLSSPARS